MSLPLLTRPPLGGCGDTGEEIPYALVTSKALQYLTRTAGEFTSQRKFSCSGWFKRHSSHVGGFIQWSPPTVDYYTALSPQGNYADGYPLCAVGVFSYHKSILSPSARYTTGLNRDFAAWYHTYVEVDVDEPVASERVRIWINGIRVAETGYIFPQSNLYGFFSGALLHVGIVKETNGVNYGDLHTSPCYMAELAVFDGRHPGTGAFGYHNQQAVWVPRKFTGKGRGTAEYGAQGFHLDFADPLNLGKDVSGNGNHFTAVGLTAANQVTDTPTSNTATFNPLQRGPATDTALGNTQATFGGNEYLVGTSLKVPPVKAYAEFKVTATTVSPAGYCPAIGLSPLSLNLNNVTLGSQGVAYTPAGNVVVKNVHAKPLPTFAAGDVIRVAYDAEAGKIWYGKNGVWNGNPAAGTGESCQVPAGDWQFAISSYSAATPVTARFSDTAWEYPAPDGFVSLATPNLPCPAIRDPDRYFTIRIRTGGSGISDLPWDPTQHKTMVVSKRRDTASDWRVNDSVRGSGKAWATNTIAAEISESVAGLTFTPSGFSIGGSTPYMGTRQDYIWRASRAAGFDIIGPISHVNGAPSTVIHAVGGKIDYAWVVNASAGGDRMVFHKALATGEFLRLNSTAKGTRASWFSSTANELTLGGGLPSGTYYVYAWRRVPGFSSFDGVAGNGSTDGTFMPLDFQPRICVAKDCSASLYNWAVFDADRSLNPVNSGLRYNLNTGDVADVPMDLVSNGVKARTIDAFVNAAGVNYICAAWAAVPFKFAHAR